MRVVVREGLAALWIFVTKQIRISRGAKDKRANTG